MPSSLALLLPHNAPWSTTAVAEHWHDPTRYRGLMGTARRPIVRLRHHNRCRGRGRAVRCGARFGAICADHLAGALGHAVVDLAYRSIALRALHVVLLHDLLWLAVVWDRHRKFDG